jgi:hypothetical protein
MHRYPKLLVRCLTACVPAVGLLIGLGPAAGASTGSVTPSAAAQQSAKNILEQYLSQHRGLLQRPSRHFSVPFASGTNAASDSTNWSGYADSGTGFTTVTAKWTEPKVSCGLWDLAAFWVGIDGDGSSSVEQDGTMTMCLFGTAYNYSWWEMYPTNSVQIVGSSVSPGDAITATVVRSGTSYKLTVTDSTHPADSFTTTQTCSSCANSSAEWIAEAPSTLFGVSSLANFGTWSPSAATVKTTSKSGTISSFTDDAITMVDSSGTTEAQPGALNKTGNAFTDTWKASS